MKLGLQMEQLNDVERMAVTNKLAELMEEGMEDYLRIQTAYLWALDQKLQIVLFAVGNEADFLAFTKGFSDHKRNQTRKVWTFS